MGPARRTVLIAALGGVGVATAGCVRIPASSGVHQAPRQTAGAAVPDIRTFPDPPVPGLGPQGIAAGFIEASAVAGPDFSIARQYLTETAAAAWDPQAGLVVFTGGSWRSPGTVVTPGPTASVVLSGTAVGRVDRTGLFSAAVTGAPFAARFRLHLQNGQWRIADPPPGLLIAADDFVRNYAAWEVMFLNPTASSLVPDALYLPDRGMDASVLAARLVAGPSTWLAPVVRTALPAGATLSSDVVPVVDGVARVGLAADLRGLDVPALDRLSAQVVTTLRQLAPEISAVTIVVGGSPVAPGQLPAEQPVDSWDRYSPDVLPAVGGDLTVVAVGPDGPQLMRGSPDSLDPVTRVPPALFASGVPRSLAVDAGSASVAVVSASGTALLVATGTGSGTGGPVRRAITGRGLTRPHFDRAGLVWTVDADGTVLTWNGSSVERVGVDLRGIQAATPLALPGVRVRRLTLARDGQRAAVVVGRRGGPATVLLMRVRRQPGTARAQVVLEAPRLITTAYPEVIDLCWLNDAQLTLLGRDATAALQVVQLRQDGSAVQELGTPADGVSLAAGPGSRQIVVGGSDGTLYVYVRPFPSRFVAAAPTTSAEPPTPSPLTPSPLTPSPATPSRLTPSPATPSPATGPGFYSPVYPG